MGRAGVRLSRGAIGPGSPLEPLDQGDLVAGVVVVEVVDEPLGQHDAEAPFADAQLAADVEVADGVVVGGGVGDLAGG